MQRMLRVRAAKREAANPNPNPNPDPNPNQAARRRAAVLSIQKAKRGRAERAHAVLGAGVGG